MQAGEQPAHAGRKPNQGQKGKNREQGILFAGIDVIGDFLTEVNVTSPTCIRELDRIYGLNISAILMDRIEQKLAV